MYIALGHIGMKLVHVAGPASENLKSEMFQNLKLFELQHDITSGKFHTVKLCFTHKIIKNII
jgi:hypothetical protein